MPDTEEALVYSVDQTAKKLGISRNLAYKLCRENKIPCLHLGSKRMLCPAKAIDALLNGEAELNGETE